MSNRVSRPIGVTLRRVRNKIVRPSYAGLDSDSAGSWQEFIGTSWPPIRVEENKVHARRIASKQ